MSTTDHTDTTGVGVPLVDIARRFTVWHIDELYTGPTGTGQYVPNVNDLIVDYVQNVMWRITQVDYTSYAFTKVIFKPVNIYNEEAEIGGCAPHSSDTFRIYIDPSSHPYTLRVDPRLRFSGTDLDHIKIFRGRDVSASGEVISAYFVNNKLTSNNIPMELASIDNVTNKTVKYPVPAWSSKLLEDNELVTIVVYSDTNEVACIAIAYTVVTNLILAADAPAKRILNVRLVSPFLSEGDETILELPVNIPIDDIPLTGEITYADGKRTIPVDGTRLRLDGLRNSGAHDTYYISSIAGQTLPLLLTYKVASDETYVGDDLYDGVICKDYTATTLDVDGAYSAKLYVVPKWLDAARGWRLEYYLYDLDRGNVFYATPYVKPAVNAAVFDPVLYGVKQRLAVTVDMSKVSSIYTPHIHVQSFAISLLSAGTTRGANYTIEYSQGQPEYGVDCYAKFYYDNITYWMLDIGCGAATKQEWLEKLYWPIYPLYDRRSESSAPTPTHFEVVTKTKTYLRTIDQWLSPFHVDFQVNESEEIMIKWICRTPADDLNLGMTPLIAHQKV